LKILIDHSLPFQFAHGGVQVQIEQTRAALERVGVNVDYLRWWDAAQEGDVVHFFGRPHLTYIEFAHKKSRKLIFSELLGGMGARSTLMLQLQRLVIRSMEKGLPRMFTGRNGWESFRRADACVALTPWEAHLMQMMFQAPAERIHVLANGVEDVFLQPGDTKRGSWLVTTASILPVKRVVETAAAAAAAGTPYWVIGKPFSEEDSYYQEFLRIQRAHPQIIRYEGGISDRAELAAVYREARGFVMLSHWETLSISALEAAACGCPLLLSDLPWAHSSFGEAVQYCPKGANTVVTAAHLRKFYDDAPSLSPPPRPLSWDEVALRLKALYESVLKQG
jgi:glycosyltransferase involved in cell wall biosynthesis